MAAAPYAVGETVQAVYEDGNWYVAKIEEVDAAEDVYLVAYEGSDLREYVYGSSIRPAGSAPQEASPSASSSASNLSTQAKRRGTIRRLTLNPQMREVVKLLESENEFSQKLNALQEFFAEPARKSMALPAKQRLLEPDLFATLFSQIEPIQQLSRRLLADLERRFDEFEGAEGAPAIGDVFVTFAPFFKLYSAYIAHHDRELTPALAKLPSRYRSYAANAAKAPGVGATLEELLALPARRISVYTELVGDVLKVTPQRDCDRAALERATKALGEVTSSVRTALSSRRNMDVIVAIEKKFIGSPGFSKPGRYIIREGALTKKPRDPQLGDRAYRFYLFNDLLAYASSIGWKMKLHGKVDISVSFHVRKLPRAGAEHRLLVCSSSKSFVLYAPDEKSRDDWVRALEAAIVEVRRTIPEQQRRVPPPVAPLPIWLPQGTVERIGEIYPAFNSVSGGAHSQGRGKEARGPTRDDVEHLLNPSVKTIEKEGQAPRQVPEGGLSPRKHHSGTASGAPPRSVYAQRQQQMNSGRPAPAPAPAPAASKVPPRRPAPAAAAPAAPGNFCTKCGAKRTGDALFCSKDGTRF